MPTSTIYTPSVSAVLNGTSLTGVQKARVATSLSNPVARLYVKVYPAVSYNDGDSLTITMGSGTNNVLSATGNVWQADYTNDGPTFELVGRGPLFKAEKYYNNVQGGLSLVSLVGGPATDEVIARAVLTKAGVSFTAGNIAGTGLVRGTLAPDAYIWKQGESALAYLQRLSKASLGYVMVETIGGDVLRVQVLGRSHGTASYSLNQGVDIFGGGHAQMDAFAKFSAVTVTGFNYGAGAVTFSNPKPIPDGVQAYVFSSDMIERAEENDPGAGISAANVARNFVEGEVEHTQIRVSGLRTPRDDLFQVGQTHLVDASWLGLSNQLLTCISVTRECDDKWFSQTLEYIGGGAVIEQAIPDGEQFYALPYQLRPRRLRDYTYTYSAQIPNLVGQDAMVPGRQSLPMPDSAWKIRQYRQWLSVISGGVISPPSAFVIPPNRVNG